MKLGKLALGVHGVVPAEHGVFPDNWETGLGLTPPCPAQTQALKGDHIARVEKTKRAKEG